MCRAAVLLAIVVLALPSDRAAHGQEAETDPTTLVHGGSAAFSLIDEERERIWLPAGSPLFESPDAASSRLGIIDALCEIEVLEQLGDWYRVHHDGRLGWVQPDLPRHQMSLDVFPDPEPLLVETPGFEIDDSPRRVDLAQQALGLSAPNGQLGPWELLTDVGDPRLIGILDRIAAGLPTSYRDRYGVDPTPPADQAVAVFATEEAYRPFESAVTHLSSLGARGHTGGKLAALFVEDNRLEEASTLLVHELTHLMNRSVLGPAPPPWIEEGIANDMAYSRIDKAGRLRLGSVNGERVVYGDRRTGVSIQYSGAVAALAELLRTRARRQGTPLKVLVQLDQGRFLDADRTRHYIESAFLVRFLLQAEKGRYAAAFKGYLETLPAAGAASQGDQLAELLGTDWPRLERAFDAWLQIQSAQLLR